MSEHEQQEELQQEELSHEEILEEYRRRKMLEHMVGPAISIVLHVLIIMACAVFLVGKSVQKSSAFEFNTREEQVKELEPELDEKLDQLKEEKIRQKVPKMKKPQVTPDEVRQQTDNLTDNMADTETNVEVESIAASTNSPLKLQGVFGNRGSGERKKALRKYAGGIGEYTEKAVLKALRWLKSKQHKNGSWGSKHREAMTGLGLLTFLAHGETTQSEEFGDTVGQAIRWLTNKITNKAAVKGKHQGYTHGISTYALCEAYGLTQLPAIKPAMEKGLQFIIDGQQEEGGWDYVYKKGSRWDLSVTGWQLQALKAGHAAGAAAEGLNEAIDKGISFLKTVNYKGSKFHYSGQDRVKVGRSSPAMQGVGVLCLQLLGEMDSEPVTVVSRHISNKIPIDWNNGPKWPIYTWYYCTQAMFHAGKSYFDPWNKKFAPMLVKSQHQKGYWEPKKQTKVFSTTLCALSLQVYYRYLPTYQEPEKRSENKNVLKMEDEGLGLEIE